MKPEIIAEQAVTTSWADYGPVLNVTGSEKIILWTSYIENPTSPEIRILAKRDNSSTDDDRFHLATTVVSATGTQLNDNPFSLNITETINSKTSVVFVADLFAAIDYLQLQIKAGASGGKIQVEYSLMAKKL